MYLAHDFRPYLVPSALRELEAMDTTAYGLREDLTVAYRNGAWTQFAETNGAPELDRWNGRSILDVFDPSVRGFYEALFRRVQSRGEPEDHAYECSSPARFQRFLMRVVPLADGRLLVLHHLAEDRPHDRAPSDLDPAAYLDAHGTASQCCHCRRTRRPDDPDTWDWVPGLLDREAPVSHGLCPVCFRHYHPRAAAKWDAAHMADAAHTADTAHAAHQAYAAR